MKTMVTLYADEGKILTNGTDYGTTISLAEGVDASAYHEISMDEYEAIIAEESEVQDA
jgi:hypothetical protein